MGNRLKIIRFEKNITQLELAILSGLSQTKLSFLENGCILPKAAEVKRIADALNVGEEDLGFAIVIENKQKGEIVNE